MHDSSGNMALNLNFIYLHRNFVNRSFVLLNKSETVCRFYFVFRGGRIGDNYFPNQYGVLSVGSSYLYVCSG